MSETTTLKVHGVGRNIGDSVFVNPKHPLFGESKDVQSYIDCLEDPIGLIVVEMQIVVPLEDDESN